MFKYAGFEETLNYKNLLISGINLKFLIIVVMRVLLITCLFFIKFICKKVKLSISLFPCLFFYQKCKIWTYVLMFQIFAGLMQNKKQIYLFKIEDYKYRNDLQIAVSNKTTECTHF